MAVEAFVIWQNTRAPAFRFDFENLPPLPETARVFFSMPPVFLDREALVISRDPPSAEYQWQDGDTAMLGTFPATFRVEYTEGLSEIVPTEYVIPIRIQGLGSA